ncbi:MAG: hypothetical protein ACOC79_03380, partial [Thermodesulfobacteriota bacterium]
MTENLEQISAEKRKGAKIPNQRELEKELSDYLTKKYGDRIKIISPFVIPKKQEGQKDGVSSE